jgi:hypothetical protein
MFESIGILAVCGLILAYELVCPAKQTNQSIQN